MKVFATICLIIGITGILFDEFYLQKKEKIVQTTPIEINNNQSHRNHWPKYIGALGIIGAIVILVTNKKR